VYVLARFGGKSNSYHEVNMARFSKCSQELKSLLIWKLIEKPLDELDSSWVNVFLKNICLYKKNTKKTTIGEECV
jgi:hypothetical protein